MKKTTKQTTSKSELETLALILCGSKGEPLPKGYTQPKNGLDEDE